MCTLYIEVKEKSALDIFFLSSFDANVNALIVLSTFGDALRFSLKKDLENLFALFIKYLE